MIKVEEYLGGATDLGQLTSNITIYNHVYRCFHVTSDGNTPVREITVSIPQTSGADQYVIWNNNSSAWDIQLNGPGTSGSLLLPQNQLALLSYVNSSWIWMVMN